MWHELLGEKWNILEGYADLQHDGESYAISANSNLLSFSVTGKGLEYKDYTKQVDASALIHVFLKHAKETNTNIDKYNIRLSKPHEDFLLLKKETVEGFIAESYTQSEECLYQSLSLIKKLTPELYPAALEATNHFIAWLSDTNHSKLKSLIMPIIEESTGASFKEEVLDSILLGEKGVQLKTSKGTERYALLTDDAYEPGFVRATYFNASGILGHDSRADYADLLDLLYAEGFNEVVHGMLERLAGTPSFLKGFEVNGILQKINSELMQQKKQISDVISNNQDPDLDTPSRNLTSITLASPKVHYEKDPILAFDTVLKEHPLLLKKYDSEGKIPRDAYFISSGENNQRYTLRHGISGYLSNLTESPEYAIRTALEKANGEVVYFNPDMVLGLIERKQPGTKQAINEENALVDDEIIMSFGKHHGKTIGEVFHIDPGYVEWLNTTTLTSGTKDFKATVKYFGELIRKEKEEKNKIPSEVDFDSIKRDLVARGISIEKSSKCINVYGMPFTVGSEAVHREMRNTFDNVNFNRETKCWQILNEYIESTDVEQRAYWLIGGLLDKMDAEKRAKIERLLKNKDDSFENGAQVKKVGANVKKLILKGMEFGIPEDVLINQIDDIGRALVAFEKEKPAFLLSNEPGTGKTFVLGGIIEELKTQYGQENVIYLTMSQDLIIQIKKDLAAFDIGHVRFETYAALGKGEVYCDENTILLADESHNLLNIGSNRGAYGQSLFQDAKFVVPASATSMENPVQAEYLAATGIFDTDEVGGFKNWVTTFGGEAKTFYGNTVYSWGGDVALAKRSRDWFFNQGLMTQRKMTIPEKQIENVYKNTRVSDYWIEVYDKIEAAYEDALYDEDGNESHNYGRIKEHSVNTLKRILESAKIEPAITEAKSAIERGRYPIIFVETKADRHIGRFRMSGAKPSSPTYDYEKMSEMMAEWEFEKNMALSSGDSFGSPPFAPFIFDIATAFNDHGIDYELPSVPAKIKEAFDKKIVTEYTGAVTAAKATKNLNDWKAGKKKLLIATMAKGGTGQSYHDTVGDHPTTQIVINLPWASRVVDQVAGRTVRYGMVGKAELSWLFAKQLNIENKLIDKVTRRMIDLGASVNGVDHKGAEAIRSLSEVGQEVPWEGVESHREGDFYGYKIALIPTADHLISQKVEPHEAFVQRVYNGGELLEVSKEPHGNTYRISADDYSIAVIDRDHLINDMPDKLALRYHMKAVAVSNSGFSVVDAVVPLKFKHNELDFEGIAQYGKSVPLGQARKGVKQSIYFKKLVLDAADKNSPVMLQSFKLDGRDNLTEEGYLTPASEERIEQFQSLGLAVPEPLSQIKEKEKPELSEVVESKKTEPNIDNKIEDVGEYIPGAIKDKYKDYLKNLRDDQLDIISMPLSKSLPHPDYEKLEKMGVHQDALALASMLRGAVPRKTKRSGRAWIANVQAVRNEIADLISIEDRYVDLLRDLRKVDAGSSKDIIRTLEVFQSLPVDLYRSAGSFRLKEAEMTFFNGKATKPGSRVYYLANGNSPVGNIGSEEIRASIEKSITYLNETLGTKKESKSKLPKLDLYTYRESQKTFIGYKGGLGMVNLRYLPEELETKREKKQYFEDNYNEIANELIERKRVASRLDENRNRQGPSIDTREITAERFRETFGLKAVQWGTTTASNKKLSNQRLIDAYKAFMDLSELLNIPPTAIGLDGTLSLAFGTRGTGGLSKSGGKTAATYEPVHVIINLTKENGAGSLAHEWFHGLDNYLAKSLKGNTQEAIITSVSSSPRITPKKMINGQLESLDPMSRRDLLDAIEALKESIKDNEFHEYSEDLDRLFSRKEIYWSKDTEKSARAFERYVKNKLADRGVVNDFLVNINESPSEEGGVYPSAKQMRDFGIERSFDLLFKSISPVKTEFGTALYRLESKEEVLLGAWVEACVEDSGMRQSESIVSGDLEAMLEELGFETKKSGSGIRVQLNDCAFLIGENEDNVWLEVEGEKPKQPEVLRIVRGVIDYCHQNNKPLNEIPPAIEMDSEIELTQAAMKYGYVGNILNKPANQDAGHLLNSYYEKIKSAVPDIEGVYFDTGSREYRSKTETNGLSVRISNALNMTDGSERDLALGLIKIRCPASSEAFIAGADLKRAVILQMYASQKIGMTRAAHELLSAASKSGRFAGVLSKKEAIVEGGKFSQTELVHEWIKPTEEHTGVLVNVVPTISDLPKHLAFGIGDNTPGVYDIRRKQSYVIANRIRDKSHAIKVALHEGIGHQGFLSFLERNKDHGGDDVTHVLEGIYKSIGEKEIAKATYDYGFDLKEPVARKEAVLEYVALMAEMGQKPIEVNKVVNSGKALVDSLYGDEITWTRNDILGLLEASRLHAIIEKSKQSGKSLNHNQVEKIKEVKSEFGRLLNANNGRLKKLLGRSEKLITWHGSPSLFSSFDISKVNTGEGAQEEGWGLYSASRKEVAMGYEKNLTSARVGTSVGIKSDWEVEGAIQNNQPLAMAFKMFQEHDRDWGAVKAILASDSFNGDVLDAAIELEKKITPLGRGYVYQLEIDIEKQSLALWDAPMSEQPEVVKSFFSKYREMLGYEKSLEELLTDWKSDYLEEVERKGGDAKAVSEALDVICFEDDTNEEAWDVVISNPSDSIDPSDIYDLISRANTGSNGMQYMLEDAVYDLENFGISSSLQESTAMMLSYGIKGIKYLDSESRDKRSLVENHNFVMFDDSLINILSTEYVEKIEKVAGLRELLGIEAGEPLLGLDHQDFIMLDKTVDSQAPKIRQLLEKLQGILKIKDDSTSLLAEVVYNNAVDKVFSGSDLEAAGYLLKQGVAGLKIITSHYKDQAVYETIDFNKSQVIVSGDYIADKNTSDMEKEARFARAELLGFDTSTVYFHGSNAAFEGFYESSNTHYLTTRPEYAYIQKTDNNYPVFLKMGNTYQARTQSEIESLRSNPDRVDQLKAQGYDSVSWCLPGNPSKGGSGWGNDYPQFVVFNQEQIRSTAAEFRLMSRGIDMLRKLDLDAEYMSLENRKVRAAQLGYDTDRVLYHGSTMEFDTLAPNSNASMFGRGVYLTTSPVEASKYASHDPMVNHDIPGKAEHLAKTLGITYSEAKEYLKKNDGNVTPCYIRKGKSIAITHDGIFYEGQRMHGFNDRSGLQNAVDVDNAEEFLVQLDRIIDGGPRVNRLMENLTGKPNASKGEAIMALLNVCNAQGFIRECAVTLKCSYVVLGDGIAPKAPSGAEHIISLSGGSDIRSINARFDLKSKNLDQLLAKMESRSGDAEFDDLFRNSVVTSGGEPLVVYRGQHGASEGFVQTRSAAISFSSRGVANEYAITPNDRMDKALSPHVIPAYLKIENPFIRNEDDPFIDMHEITRKLSLNNDEAIAIAIKFSESIESTDNFNELAEEYDADSVEELLEKSPVSVTDLYFDAYKFIDDAEMVGLMKQKGFDGAIHVGNGTSSDAIEYKVFSEDQIIPKIDFPYIGENHSLEKKLANELSAEVVELQGGTGRLLIANKDLEIILATSESNINQAAVDAYGYEAAGLKVASIEKLVVAPGEFRNIKQSIASLTRILKRDGFDALVVGSSVDSVVFGALYEHGDIELGSGLVKSISERAHESLPTAPRFLFAGVASESANSSKLDEAKALSEAGVSEEEIWKETDWYKGVDGEWKYEINDSDAEFVDSLIPMQITRVKNGDSRKCLATTTLGKLIKHPSLYEAYPDLKKLKVNVFNGGNYSRLKGSADGQSISVYLDKMAVTESVKSVLLHETQHIIQDIEKFASGSSISEEYTKRIKKVAQLKLEKKEFKEADNALSVIRSEMKRSSLMKLHDHYYALSKNENATRQASKFYNSDEYALNTSYIIDSIGLPPKKHRKFEHNEWLKSASLLICGVLEREFEEKFTLSLTEEKEELLKDKGPNAIGNRISQLQRKYQKIHPALLEKHDAGEMLRNITSIEGGENVDESAYLKSAGEVEARLVEARLATRDYSSHPLSQSDTLAREQFVFTRQDIKAAAERLQLEQSNIVIVNKSKELPAHIRAAVQSNGNLSISGATYGEEIYLVKAGIDSREALEKTLLHEASHIGVNSVFGRETSPAYGAFWVAVGRREGLMKQSKLLGQNLDPYVALSDNLLKKGEISRHQQVSMLVDEFIAHASADKNYVRIGKKLKVAVGEFLGKIRNSLRKIGFNGLSELKTSDIFYLCRQVNKASRNVGKVVVPQIISPESPNNQRYAWELEVINDLQKSLGATELEAVEILEKHENQVDTAFNSLVQPTGFAKKLMTEYEADITRTSKERECRDSGPILR